LSKAKAEDADYGCRRFYTQALGLREVGPISDGAALLAGDTVLIVEASADAPHDAAFEGKGWRYITFQVFEVDQEHANVIAHSGREALSASSEPLARSELIQNYDC
jgi:lactoylglutathione lyase